MKNRILVVLVLLILLFQAPSILAGDKVLSENAKKLMEIYKIDRSLEQTRIVYNNRMRNHGKSIVDEAKKEAPMFDEVYLQRIEKAYLDYVEETSSLWPAEKIKLKWIELYFSSFSEKEIAELVDFYTSPTGQKSLGLQVTVSAQMIDFINNEAKAVGEKPFNDFKSKLYNILSEYDKTHNIGLRDTESFKNLKP